MYTLLISILLIMCPVTKKKKEYSMIQDSFGITDAFSPISLESPLTQTAFWNFGVVHDRNISEWYRLVIYGMSPNLDLFNISSQLNLGSGSRVRDSTEMMLVSFLVHCISRHGISLLHMDMNLGHLAQIMAILWDCSRNGITCSPPFCDDHWWFSPQSAKALGWKWWLF